MNKPHALFTLVLCLLVSCPWPGNADAEEAVDPNKRLGMADSRTYVSYYLKEKKYEPLGKLLREELTKIETDCRKSEGNATSGAVCDLEGELYILDDLAFLHTYGQVDFEKAKNLNTRAAQIHEEIRGRGLESLPVSHYFNANRFFYYTFYMDKGFFEDEHTMLSAFDADYTALVRKRDFEQTGERIAARKAFLDAKLGLSAPDIRETGPSAINPDLFKAYLDFIETTPGYSPFERAYASSALAVRALKGGGGNRALYLDAILKADSMAAMDTANASIAVMDKVNRLNYWVAVAALEKGMNATAIARHERLVSGIDRMETAKTERIQAMSRLLSNHYYEELRSANELRDTGKTILAGMASAFVVLFKVTATAAAAAGDTFMAMQGQQSSLTKDAIDLMWKDQEYDWGVNDAVMEADFLNPIYQLDEGDPNRLSEFMSPYALRLNRYLNKYELRAYLAALGDAYASRGRWHEAYAQYAEAIEIIEHQRVTIGMEKQRIAFFGAEQNLYPKIIRGLAAQGDYGPALEYVERSKSRAFLDILGGGVSFKSVRQQETVRRDALAKAEIDSILESTVSEREKATQAAPDVQRAVAVRQGVSDNTLEEIHTLSNVNILDHYAIQRLIPEDSALIEYYLDQDTLYIFTVADREVECAVVPLDTAGLIADIKALRASILARRFSEDTARGLYGNLIGPVEKRIKGKRLIIVPHKALHYLPFQCLMNGDQWLVAEHAVSYTPSATILSIVGKKRVSRRGKALVVGNPTGDLEHAQQEAVAIGETLPDAEVILGSNATEPLLKNRSGKYAVIHIASHGEFDHSDPMASRILLNPEAGDDGQLMTKELFGCRWRASLVTLSACQSGVGGYSTGDELVGLQRGVFFAGTQSLLASTWRVDDASTRHLMIRFYAHAMKDTKDVALQKAQMETMKKYAQPFHWASFRLIGAANRIYESGEEQNPEVAENEQAETESGR